MTPEGLTTDLRETLSVFGFDGEPRTTPEVAERLDVGRRTTYNRLQRLAEMGKVETKKVGANARVWWRIVEYAPGATGGARANGSQPDTPTRDGDQVDEATRLALSNADEYELLVDAVEEYAIFSLDPDGFISSWNAGAEQIKGYTAEETLGEHFSLFYTPADREAGIPERNLATAAAEGSYETSGWRLRKDGTRFWAQVVISAIVGPDGDHLGFAKVTRDMTDHRHADVERELLYETSRAVATAEASVEGVTAALGLVCETTDWEYAEAWLPDDDGTLRRSDAAHVGDGFGDVAAASEAAGYDPGEGLPGRVYANGSPEWTTAVAADEPNESRAAALAAAGVAAAVAVPVRTEGSVSGVAVFLSRSDRDGDDRVVSLLSSIADELGGLLRIRPLGDPFDGGHPSVDRLLSASPVGIAVLDTDGRYVRVNERARELLGLRETDAVACSPDEVTLYDDSGREIPLEDHPGMQALDRRERVLDWEARVRRPDEPERWLTVNASPVFDADGDVEHVVVTVQDVTDRKEQTRRVERRQEAIETELSAVLARISDAFFAVDEDWRVTYLNDRARTLFDDDEPLGQDVFASLEDALATALRGHVAGTPAATEAAQFREYLPDADEWVEVSVYPSETGASVYAREVSDEVARRESSDRAERIVDTIEDGVFVLDEDDRYTMVNDAYAALVGHDRDALIGAHISTVLDEEAVDRVERAGAELASADTSQVTYELEVTTPAGRTWVGETIVTSLVTAGGDERVGVVRDVTAARQREADLAATTRRYRALVDNFPNGTVSLVDHDLRYVTIGGEVTNAVADDVSDLVGQRVVDILPDDIGPQVAENYRRALEGSTVTFETTVGDTRYRSTYVPIREDDEIVAAMGISIDVTSQREMEATLRRTVRQQECLVGLGQDALGEDSTTDLIDRAVAVVCETLETSHCVAMRFDSDDSRLRLAHGIGWEPGVVGEADVPATDDHHAGFTFNTGQEVVVEDLTAESRFTVPDILDDHGIRAGVTAQIGPADDPWGVLAVYDTASMAFSSDDTAFVQSVANVLAAAIDRRRRMRELDTQRNALAAVNSLNAVAREITAAVLDQSTRAEIERVLCARLAESDSYTAAWIGEPPDGDGAIHARAAAGPDSDEGDLAAVDIDQAIRECIEAALRTEAPQFAAGSDLGDTDAETIGPDGVGSVAVVPISHEGTSYGLLTVHTDRTEGFGRTEREVIEQVATVASHAIAAADRKRALVSDDLVEITFGIPNVYGPLETVIEPTGRYTFDHMIPLEDGEFIVHGRAEPDAVPHLEELAEVNPMWRSIRTFESGRSVRIELHATDLPVFSAIADRGGYIEEIVIEDGDLQATILFAPSVDIGGVIDTLEHHYPTARLHSRRQVTRTRDTRQRITHALASALTDRQRTALEAAYYGGYFEWPRAMSAEEVAESMGVAPSTFHQHLRKAEQKVLDEVYTSPVGPDDEEP